MNVRYLFLIIFVSTSSAMQRNNEAGPAGRPSACASVVETLVEKLVSKFRTEIVFTHNFEDLAATIQRYLPETRFVYDLNEIINAFVDFYAKHREAFSVLNTTIIQLIKNRFEYTPEDSGLALLANLIIENPGIESALDTLSAAVRGCLNVEEPDEIVLAILDALNQNEDEVPLTRIELIHVIENAMPRAQKAEKALLKLRELFAHDEQKGREQIEDIISESDFEAQDRQRRALIGFCRGHLSAEEIMRMQM